MSARRALVAALALLGAVPAVAAQEANPFYIGATFGQAQWRPGCPDSVSCDDTPTGPCACSAGTRSPASLPLRSATTTSARDWRGDHQGECVGSSAPRLLADCERVLPVR